MAMTIVHNILKQMPVVGRSQRKFLVLLFSTILALRGRVNFRNLSRYSDYSERTIARQFRRSFDWPDFHQRVMTTALHPQAEVISAQDASFIPKSGKQTFGLGHFFNGCAGRAERGLEISTLAVVDVTHRCAFTLAVAQTPPTCAMATKQEQETTLVDFYAQQLRAHHHRLPAWVTYHAVDGYFAKKKYLDAVVDLRLHPITKLRGDADCRFLFTGPHPKRRGAHRKYDGKVHWQDLSRFAALGTLAEAEHVHLYTALVWHVSLKRKLRVVLLINRKAPAKPRYIVLASTDLALDGRKLVELYGARFQIEFLFRDSKQFTGLNDCQARAEAALDFHFNAALATLNLVRAEDLNAQSGDAPQVFSMASWKPRQFNERLLDFFIAKLALDPTWVKNHPAYDELRIYGAIAA
jgi:DDE superfamily endonuclease